MDCPICVEHVATCKTVTCPSCQSVACFKCIGKYIEGITTDNIKCMSCSTNWNRVFLYKNLPIQMIFGKGIVRKQRENILFEREKARLPESQEVIKEIKRKEAIREEMEKMETRLAELRYDYHCGRKKTSEDNNKMICGCPINDCRGFITSQNYACGLCNTQICKSCHVVKACGEDADEHVCKEDDKESIRLLRKDTKPCPGCGAASKKTEGCAQVWCMVCKKAWNWTTGQIETGYVHATDYFNYMRANGLAIPERAQAAGGVGGACRVVDPYTLPRVVSKFAKSGYCTEEDSKFIFSVYQIGCEYQYQRNDREPIMDDLRIQFLMQQINEEKWRNMLLRRDKDHAFRLEVSAMTRVYSQTVFEYLTEICNLNNMPVTEIQPALKDIIDKLKTFDGVMKEAYANIAKLFQSRKMSPFRA